MKEVYYFSHDSNSQDDPKCMLLIDQLGMEGYGIFWALIEKLRSEKDYKLPLLVCSSFARRWGTSKEKIEAVVCNYNLFIIENKEFFYSERLKTSMEYKSLKAKESANKRWNNATALPPHTTAMRNDAIKVKESKVNKEESINFAKTKLFTQMKEVFSEPNKEQKEELNKFYLYWTEPNKSGTKVKYQLEKTWDTKRRLETWFNNATKFNPKKNEPKRAANY